VADEIFCVHAKRSSRLEPGHWLLDSKLLTPIGELSPKSGGWAVELKGNPLPILTFETPDAACDYLGAATGRRVRKISARQLARLA
jgi:hypothetical protein